MGKKALLGHTGFRNAANHKSLLESHSCLQGSETPGFNLCSELLDHEIPQQGFQRDRDTRHRRSGSQRPRRPPDPPLNRPGKTMKDWAGEPLGTTFSPGSHSISKSQNVMGLSPLDVLKYGI